MLIEVDPRYFRPTEVDWLLGDPTKARERLGFVMPGDSPYQVQLPPGAAVETGGGAKSAAVRSNDPWYTSLWHTIADAPHGPPPPPTTPTTSPTLPLPPPPEPVPVPPGG